MKINTAFISSTGDLTKERNAILRSLLQYDIFPFCMENFTVDSIGGFRQIEELIRDSDFFFLILGTRYGSTDRNTGKSYTEMEYTYAIENQRVNQTKILVFLLKEAQDLIENPKLDEMSDEELEQSYPFQKAEDTRRQMNLIRNILREGMICKINSIEDISVHLSQFIQFQFRDGSTKGWIRGISYQNFGIEFGKDYYHFHVTEGDDSYLRIGRVNFSVNSSDGNPQIHIRAVNYKAEYDEKNDKLNQMSRHRSEWEGNYSLYEENKLKGIYTVSRYTTETTHGQLVESGERNGIHIFAFEKDMPYIMSGISQDAYPRDNRYRGLKSCEIFIFDNEEKRLDFLKKEYSDILQNVKR